MMRAFSWMIGVVCFCLIQSGCSYSVGGWAGSGEDIREYEPTLRPIIPVDMVTPAVGDTGADVVADSGVFETEPWQASDVTKEAVDEGKDVVEVTSGEADAVVSGDVADVVPPVVVTDSQTSGSESVEAVIAAIEKMESNSTKRRLYIAVAKRSDLDEAGQERLIDSVFGNLFSESAIEDVLITLIQNPQFADAGRDSVARHLKDLVSDGSRQRILGAMSQ